MNEYLTLFFRNRVSPYQKNLPFIILYETKQHKTTQKNPQQPTPQQNAVCRECRAFEHIFFQH